MKKFLATVFAIIMTCSMAGYKMKDYSMERVNASFRTDFAGNVTASPEVTLIHDRTEFSAYLSSPARFFDGRFAFYEQYEGNGGVFFESHDLIAVITRGEKTLRGVEKSGDIWQVSLDEAGGDRYMLYFITVPKEEGMAGAALV